MCGKIVKGMPARLPRRSNSVPKLLADIGPPRSLVNTYGDKFPNEKAEGEAAGQGQAFRYCLLVLVFINDVPARTCSCIVLGLDLGEQTLNATGAGLHGWLVLARAAFVLSRATRLAISSMRGRASRPSGRDRRSRRRHAAVPKGHAHRRSSHHW